MSTVKSGSISVEDGVRAVEEYAPARKVRVELHFEVAEGTNAESAMNRIAVLANAQVRALLHQAPEVVEAKAEAALTAADAGVNDPADVDAKVAAIVAKSAATKAKNRAANAAKEGLGDLPGEPVQPAPPTEDAGLSAPVLSAVSSVTEPGLDDLPGEIDPGHSVLPASQGTDVALDVLDDILSAGPAEITNEQLADAVTARNGIIKNNDAIKGLIGSFSAGVRPFHAAMIPQAQRPDFLAKLAALPKAAGA